MSERFHEQGKVFLFGGGPRPKEAVGRFAEECLGPAGEKNALLICWASTAPEKSAPPLVEDLSSHGVSSVQVSLDAPRSTQERILLLGSIRSVGGIFFSGGDQNRFMRVLRKLERECDIRQAFFDAYQRGSAFGGTSAGTAVMSLKMIAGQKSNQVIDADKVRIKEGLGILPNLVLDQHFLKRKRQNRLFGVVLRHPELLGVGVDEGAALKIEGGRTAEVVGDEKVMIVDGLSRPGALIVEVLEPGSRFDLIDRKRL